jgi:hypothetical protein
VACGLSSRIRSEAARRKVTSNDGSRRVRVTRLASERDTRLSHGLAAPSVLNAEAAVTADYVRPPVASYDVLFDEFLRWLARMARARSSSLSAWPARWVLRSRFA